MPWEETHTHVGGHPSQAHELSPGGRQSRHSPINCCTLGFGIFTVRSQELALGIINNNSEEIQLETISELLEKVMTINKKGNKAYHLLNVHCINSLFCLNIS